ncbi:MAG: hypothetical protein ACRCYU_12375 [Nocardioides sp.]
MDALAERLRARPVGPAVPRPQANPEQHFARKIELSGNTLTAEIRVEDDEVTQGTALEYLTEEGQDPAHWSVTGFRKIKYGQGMESVRFTFTRVGSAGSLVLPDLDDLHEQVRRDLTSGTKAGAPARANRTVVGVIADPQVGKVSERGGVSELLARLEKSRKAWADYLDAERPDEVVLVDAGDAIENFENTGSQERTNDLQLTEQIRLWRRVFWSWIETAAHHAPVVKVVSVPSNHCRVRRGKANLATPDDDFGIEVLSQVADMAGVYPEKYGHVSFYSPEKEHESLALPTLGGKVLGFAHGHQVGSPEKLPQWLAGQALGRTPIGMADITVFGHWHNLRVQTVGDDRWMFIAPTSDNGSAWFRNISGNESAPGVLTFTVESDGWRGLHVC